jgi:hypothetical protein
MDVEKALAYVRTRGDAVQQARLASILWNEPPTVRVLEDLATLQQPDGSFAYWVPQVGNICDTPYVLQWFHDLSVYREPAVDRACRFLLHHQQPDGGWDELEAVRLRNPPEWMTSGRIETRVWLTAFCAHVLICFGYAEAPGTHCPTDHLLAHCDQSGRLAGYLRATWLSLPMLAFYPGVGSEPFRRAVAVMEVSYSPDWEGAYLAWLLRCLQDAGLPAEHRLANRALQDLEHMQRTDGSWAPEEGEGEEQAARATVDALRAQKGDGRIADVPRPARSWLPSR